MVVGLNMAGVVRGYQLKKARKGVVFGAVVLRFPVPRPAVPAVPLGEDVELD